MKRLLTLTWMILLLTACGAVPEPVSAPVPDREIPAADAPVPPPKREERLRYQLGSRVSEDAAAAEDGSTLARYRFELPVLTVLREDGTPVETPSAEVFNRRFEKWAAAEEFEGLVMSAGEDLQFCREEGLDWFGGYEMELTTEVYQTEGLISVAGLYYTYTGGAHPNTWHLSWNFDLTAGVFLDPGDLAVDSAAFEETVHQELIRQAEEVAAECGLPPEELFWADYREILSNWAGCAVYFDESGMTVAYSPYELAAYGAGPQIFTISYDWLRPYLSERGIALLGLDEL